MSEPTGSQPAFDPLLEGYLDFGAELLAERLRAANRSRQVLLSFTEVMDSFDRFLAATRTESELPHMRTVRLIARQFQQALQNAGAAPMQCEWRVAEAGLHEIAGSRYDPAVEEDTILEVVVRGYVDAEGEPLRKARVIVASGILEESKQGE